MSKTDLDRPEPRIRPLMTTALLAWLVGFGLSFIDGSAMIPARADATVTVPRISMLLPQVAAKKRSAAERSGKPSGGYRMNTLKTLRVYRVQGPAANLH